MSCPCKNIDIANRPSAPAFAIEHCRCDGLQQVCLHRGGFEERFLTAFAAPGEPPFSMFDQLTECVRACDARIVRQYVFGPCTLHSEGVQALNRTWPKHPWPVTWIEDNAEPGEELTGSQAIILRGVDVEPIRDGDRVVGCWYEDTYARYALLGEVRADDLSWSREEQAANVFEKIERLLAPAGMDFSHVAKTWLYLDRLLEWYDEFNAVRTAFFHKRGVFDGLVPASTGIGAGNHAGAAVVADVRAILPKETGLPKVFAVPSPLQCPAPAYGSSFSRAVEVAYPDHRKLFISGTASIAPEGHTVHLDDVPAQVELTLDVIQGILESRGMTWEDTTRGVAYFTETADIPLLAEAFAKRGVGALPIVPAHADICRHDLLFEMELDAARAGTFEG